MYCSLRAAHANSFGLLLVAAAWSVCFGGQLGCWYSFASLLGGWFFSVVLGSGFPSICGTFIVFVVFFSAVDASCILSDVNNISHFKNKKNVMLMSCFEYHNNAGIGICLRDDRVWYVCWI
jgi:hypothetical protein